MCGSVHTVIAAQTGNRRQHRIGAHCQIGGQVGIVGHIRSKTGPASRRRVAAGAITEKGQAVYGSPAIPLWQLCPLLRSIQNCPNWTSASQTLEGREGSVFVIGRCVILIAL